MELIRQFVFSVKDFKNLINLARKTGMGYFYIVNDGQLHYSSVDSEGYTLLEVFFTSFDVKELERFGDPRGILDVADVWKTIYRLKEGNIVYSVPLVNRSYGVLYYMGRQLYHKVYDETPYIPLIPRIQGDVIEFKIGLRNLLNAVETTMKDTFALFSVKNEVGIGEVEDEKVISTFPLNIRATGDFSNFFYNKARVLNALQALEQLSHSSAVATVKVTDRRLLILEMPFKLGHVKYVTTSIYLEKAKATFNGRDVSDKKVGEAQTTGEAVMEREYAQNATV